MCTWCYQSADTKNWYEQIDKLVPMIFFIIGKEGEGGWSASFPFSRRATAQAMSSERVGGLQCGYSFNFGVGRRWGGNWPLLFVWSVERTLEYIFVAISAVTVTKHILANISMHRFIAHIQNAGLELEIPQDLIEKWHWITFPLCFWESKFSRFVIIHKKNRNKTDYDNWPIHVIWN